MPVPDHGQFIDGVSRAPSAGASRIEVENPAVEQVIATVPDGTASDVNEAVAAARRAFPMWAGTAPSERVAFLRRLAVLLEEHRDDIADLVTAELGAPRRIARAVHAQLPIDVTTSTADVLHAYPFHQQIGNSWVVQQPVGVVAAITPWNFPLHQVTSKVIPALAAGATVVLKPSELAPLSALRLADLMMQAGLPAGAFNVVTGTAAVGERLVAHDDVDVVSFTGSVATGAKVSATAARTVKPVLLELGGKSASLILPDADLATAVKVTVANAFFNSGQACNAWTRLLVPADQLDQVNDWALAAAGRQRLGDPIDDGTRVGPVVSAGQRDRVLDHIAAAERDGVELLTGGSALPEGFERGHFVRPTIFTDVNPAAAIAQEEVFGPVLCITGYRDETQAVELANGTKYGLGGAVWGANPEHAVDVAQQIRTGQVDVNGAPFNPRAPFGGFKRSGYGRELGEHGLAEFLAPQSIQLPKGSKK